MKLMMAIMALASFPALAACGDRGDDNITAEEINRLGPVEENVIAEPGNQLPIVNEVNNIAPVPEASAPAEPPRKASPTPRPERPAPRPKAPPPPPVDPHAGHDMGNMANMSH